MNFLPIAERELRSAARKPATYLYRSLIAFFVMLLGLVIVLAGFGGVISPAQAGRAVFAAISGTLYVGACLDGAISCGGSLSREHRDNTLGFLFLTNLKGYDVILGKLVWCMLNSFYAIVAALPVMAFCFFLGGVSAGDFVRMMFALPNAIFFSASIGLLMAAFFRTDRVFAVTLAVVILFSIAVPLAGSMGASISSLDFICLACNPGGAFLAALGSGTSKIPSSFFAWSFGISQMIAWGCLFIASYILPQRVREKAEPKASLLKQALLSEPKIMRSLPRAPGFRTKLELHSLLSAGSGNKFHSPIIFIFGTVALMLIGFMLWQPLTWFSSSDLPPIALVITIVLHWILKYLAADQASRALIHRRQSGELELLLTTPLDGDEIIRGHMLALKRQLISPILFVLLIDTIFTVVIWAKLGGWDGFGWAMIFGAEILWMLMNLYTLSWVGLWQGMKSKSTGQALRRTIGWVVVSPWATTILCFAVLGGLTGGRALNPQMSPVGAISFFVFLLMCNFGLTGTAINELREKFRLLASHQEILSTPKRPGKMFQTLRNFWKPAPRALSAGEE